MPSVSVILTTFERPRALACVLEKYKCQSFGDFEIVVGNDGSGEETEEVIRKYGGDLPVPLVHVWSEHLDHGRTRVLNNAVRAASGEYLIFSDGDCIPESDYVERHYEARRPGCFLNGRRLMLPREYEAIGPEDVARDEHRKGYVTKSRREIAKLTRKSYFYRLLRRWRWDRLRLLGANFSMWRSDYVAINGYDESYIGWGAADEDFRRRLHGAGIRWASVMKTAHVWHIPHPNVPSKPTKVKLGRNVGKYDSWCYLIQPVLGMRARRPEEIGIVVAGAAEAGRPCLETSRGPRRLQPEVALHLIGLDPPGAPGGTAAQVHVGLVPRGISDAEAMAALSQHPKLDAYVGPDLPMDGLPLWPPERPDLSDLAKATPGEAAQVYFERNELTLRRAIREALDSKESERVAPEPRVKRYEPASARSK